MFAFSWRLNGWGFALTLPEETQTHNQALEHFFHWNYAVSDFFDFAFILFIFFFCWTHFSHVIPTVLFDVHVSVCFLFWSVFHFRMPNVRTVINFMAQTRKQNGKMESKEHVLFGGEFQYGPWNFVFSLFFFYLNFYYSCFVRSTKNLCTSTLSKLFVAELTWLNEKKKHRSSRLLLMARERN